jgi:hypothetical protein
LPPRISTRTIASPFRRQLLLNEERSVKTEVELGGGDLLVGGEETMPAPLRRSFGFTSTGKRRSAAASAAPRRGIDDTRRGCRIPSEAKSAHCAAFECSSCTHRIHQHVRADPVEPGR